VLFEGRLTDDFHVQFRHRLAKFMVNDVPTVAIEDRDEVEVDDGTLLPSL